MSNLPPPRPKKKRVIDTFGNIIPENLIPMWESRFEVVHVAEALRTQFEEIKKASSQKTSCWSGLNFNSTLMHLENALMQVKGAIPHCVCPYCHGIGCLACKCVGMMTKFQYDTVPDDMKGK